MLDLSTQKNEPLSDHGESSPQSGDRRKQKCPTKTAQELAAAAAVTARALNEETDEDTAELAHFSEQSPQSILYHHEIVNISPVTVTCSSNGREEIVGYNQSQFLDEVISYFKGNLFHLIDRTRFIVLY